MSNLYKLNNNKEKAIKGILLSLLMYGLLFENILEKYIPILGNIDEVVGVVIIALGIVEIIRAKGKNACVMNSNKILLSIAIFIAIGLAGNIIYGYQYIQYALKEILTLRGLVCYAMIPIVFSEFNIDDYKVIINKNLKVITIVLFLLTVLNLFLSIFPYYEVRFNIKAQQLLFTHPTYLATTGTLIIAMLSGLLYEDKKNYIYIVLMYIVVLLTLRTKAIIFLMLYIYLLFIIEFRKRKLMLVDFIILGAIAVGISINQVTEYLQNPDWARSAISINSVKIAESHFPFGSGFGTFGTWISGVNYSPLYFTYNMQTIWGLAPDYYNFVSDTFWPMILAQFGFIGLIIFIYILSKIYINIKNNTNIYKYFGQISILAYLVSSSIGESSFMGPQSLIAFIIIALLNERDEVI